jgi:hypothetical protein
VTYRDLTYLYACQIWLMFGLSVQSLDMHVLRWGGVLVLLCAVDGFSSLVPRNILAIPLRDHEGRCVAVLEVRIRYTTNPYLSIQSVAQFCSGLAANRRHLTLTYLPLV